VYCPRFFTLAALDSEAEGINIEGQEITRK
jgi:hypothetical protein